MISLAGCQKGPSLDLFNRRTGRWNIPVPSYSIVYSRRKERCAMCRTERQRLSLTSAVKSPKRLPPHNATARSGYTGGAPRTPAGALRNDRMLQTTSCLVDPISKAVVKSAQKGIATRQHTLASQDGQATHGGRHEGPGLPPSAFRGTIRTHRRPNPREQKIRKAAYKEFQIPRSTTRR